MATIIRKEAAHEVPTVRMVEPVSFSFADIRSQADDYLETVRHEAAKIVQQAHRDGERIRRDAEVAGRKAAESAIERILDEKVAQRMKTLLPALERLAQQINDAKGELLSHWEQSAMRVITAISERVVRRQLDRQPEIALELIAETLQLAAQSADFTVHISSVDHENLGSQIERLAATICQLAPSRIVPDPALTAGDCRIETRFGTIDNTVQSQLRRIEADLE
jgi:flagellar assembly protein FliH